MPKSKDENSRHEIKKGPNWLSHTELVFAGVSIFNTQFWICFTGGCTIAANIPHQIKLWQKKILRIFWIDTQFHWTDTQFCSPYSYTQVGESVKQGLQDETRAQRQGDFTNNFNTFYFCDLLVAYSHEVLQRFVSHCSWLVTVGQKWVRGLPCWGAK